LALPLGQSPQNTGKQEDGNYFSEETLIFDVQSLRVIFSCFCFFPFYSITKISMQIIYPSSIAKTIPQQKKNIPKKSSPPKSMNIFIENGPQIANSNLLLFQPNEPIIFPRKFDWII